MKFRQYLLIFTFIFLCLMSAFLTYNHSFDKFGTVELPNKDDLKNNQNLEESYFKNIDYFLSDKNIPSLSFNSDLLTISNTDSKILGHNPKGIAYTSPDSAPINFQAKNARVFYNKKEINLENKVEVDLEDTKLIANQVKILLGINQIYADGDVRTFSNNEDNSEQVLIEANKLECRPKEKIFEYKQRVSGNLKRRKKYEESLSFKTDSMLLNGVTNTAELKGNVKIKQENYDIFANTGSIFLENYNKKLKYYSLSDDVRLEEKVESDGRKFSRKAFSEKLEGIMSEKKIILTGFPKVFQDKDVIKGNMIVIRENVETVEVDDANTNITLKHDENKRE